MHEMKAILLALPTTATAIRARRTSICCLLAFGLVCAYSGQLLAQNQNIYLPIESSARQASGSEVFLKYCAGCHGPDGFAAYEPAPSFSMGERLHKSDQALLYSVLDGRHAMPYWEHKLSNDMVLAAIAFLRVMAQRYQSGLPPRQEPLPDTRYQFKPVGEDDDYWQNREQPE